MQTTLSGDTLDRFQLWLLGREFDIAVGEEDLGELQDIFKEIIGREAKE